MCSANIKPIITANNTQIAFHNKLKSVIASFSLINLLVGLLMIYAIITSFMGKYTQIPWVSGIIKANLRM